MSDNTIVPVPVVTALVERTEDIEILLLNEIKRYTPLILQFILHKEDSAGWVVDAAMMEKPAAYLRRPGWTQIKRS